MKSLFYILAACACVLVNTNSGFAADQGKAAKNKLPTELSHSSPNILPDPGAPFELVLALKNTRVTEQSVRLLLNVDGQLMELNSLSARFNNQELPEYKFQIHAPLAEIQYQFVLKLKDNSTIKSQFYTVRRKCIPQILAELNASNSTSTESQSGDERLAALVGKARGYEYQIESYERAGKILADIKTLLGSQE